MRRKVGQLKRDTTSVRPAVAAGTAALRLSETFVMGLEYMASDFVLDGGVGGE